MTETRKASPSDAGCWIDGHWGQYTTARMVEIAAEHGYADAEVVDAASRELSFMGPHMSEDTRTDEEATADSETVQDAADEVEQWMTDNVAPDGYLFEWVDGEFFLSAGELDIWQMLEQNAPDGCEAIQDLYSWSLNYDAGKGPFALFLDLIGWSEDELGEPIYSLSSANLGYVELSKLADALGAYAERPHDVREYVDALMEAEAR